MGVLDEIEAAIPSLRRYAVAMTRDRDIADDLVQDTLEKAVRRQQDWRGEGSVSAWLFRILLNLLRDRHRSQARRPRIVPLDTGVEPPQPMRQESGLALAETHDAIWNLPVEQREVILLVGLEGLSLREASAQLGIAEGTAASRLGRARMALRAVTGRANSNRSRGTG